MDVLIQPLCDSISGFLPQWGLRFQDQRLLLVYNPQLNAEFGPWGLIPFWCVSSVFNWQLHRRLWTICFCPMEDKAPKKNGLQPFIPMFNFDIPSLPQGFCFLRSRPIRDSHLWVSNRLFSVLSSSTHTNTPAWIPVPYHPHTVGGYAAASTDR